MTGKVAAAVSVIVLALSVAAGQWLAGPRAVAEASPQQAGNVPVFQVDSSWQWPPKLPNNWVVGVMVFVAVDRRDNVWVLHRPRQVPVEQKDRAAPAVLQFDATGTFVQAWGGPGPGTTGRTWNTVFPSITRTMCGSRA